MLISRSCRQLLWIAAAVIALVLGFGATGFRALGFRATASASAAPAPTFTKEVAPILFKHCVNCHRPGEIGSAVSLLSYETAKPWAASIKDQVARREMPPWPADPNGSLKFRNDPRLSQQEIDTLVAWVNGGAPKGNDADLPPIPSAPNGWLHPKGLAPDLVIQLPEFHLPAKGEIPYQRYLAKVPVSEDKWIVALQVLPSNRALVHHMAITEVALENGVTPADLDKLALVAEKLGLPKGSIGTQAAVVDPSNPAESDMLGVYTPGTTFEEYGDDSAKVLRGGKNMYLNFNIHYQTIGEPATDRPSLALWFEPGPPKHQIFRVPASGETIIADGKELLTDTPGPKAEGTSVVIPPIPPNAENYEVIGVTAYTEPVTIYQLQPHAHLRGKDFKYVVIYPDGRELNVLSVPKYDFHWQLAYELEKPLSLPAGSKLIVTAHYDNSHNNEHLRHHHDASDTTHNLDPDKEVNFREANQSWDEMFTPFIQYSIDAPAQPSSPSEVHGESKALEIAEVVGCLQQTSSGEWMLTNASDPVESATQPTSMAAVKAAADRPLGNQQDQLLGVDVFFPSSYKGQKTVVKGVLIERAKDKEGSKESRLNVTSLQTVSATCR